VACHSAASCQNRLGVQVKYQAILEGSILKIKVFENRAELSRAAAVHAASSLAACLCAQGYARLVAATGASQLEFLDALTSMPGLDWQGVELFHLDEYVGLPKTHPASFRKYIYERIIQKTGIARYHLLDGEHDPQAVAHEVGQALALKPIDLVFAGIGENSHLAFNDPPADFQTEQPFFVVELDESCRRQQVNEGWFARVQDVPAKAITMSVRQILRSREIISVVPDKRKASAVKASIEGEISPMTPASILRQHPNVTLYLDADSASLLSQKIAIER
jgi:glucosamine-6-phosphate deaminase